MNIAFAKIGKSCKFKTKFSPTGGDNEAPNMLIALANNNPDITFHMIGRSDLRKLTEAEMVEIFPYGNVIDMFQNVSITKTDEQNFDGSFCQSAINYFSDKKIDGAIVVGGTLGAVNLPGKIYRVTEPTDQFAKITMMSLNYAAHIIAWLNQSKIPYVEIINDPRYVLGKAKDLFHLPFKSLSQYDYSYPSTPIKSYEDQTRVDPPIDNPVVYAGMETAFLVGREFPTEIPTKNCDIRIVLNEGDPSRYDILNEWILKQYPDVEIYGKWDCEESVTDDRFKGPVELETAQELISQSKYTFIIPIRKGWVTSKYIEMIHAGVIPFLHPTYDEQLHIKGIPKILRPETPEEMQSSISRIESTPGMYDEILLKLQRDILLPEYYDGTFLSKTILSQFDSNYELSDLSKFNKVEINDISAFFD